MNTINPQIAKLLAAVLFQNGNKKCIQCAHIPYCDSPAAVEVRAQLGMSKLDEDPTDNWVFGMPVDEIISIMGDDIISIALVDIEESIIGVENHLLWHAAMRTLKDISINKLSVRDFLSDYGDEINPEVLTIVEFALAAEEKAAENPTVVIVVGVS